MAAMSGGRETDLTLSATTAASLPALPHTAVQGLGSRGLGSMNSGLRSEDKGQGSRVHGVGSMVWRKV
eukprot:3730403-Rhodomonas_salina.1